jgi:hypothetical protein
MQTGGLRRCGLAVAGNERKQPLPVCHSERVKC